MQVSFDVIGTPVAQGSKKAYVVSSRRGLVVDTNVIPLDRYRSDIRNEAAKAMAGTPPTGSQAAVAAFFNVARPPSHFTTKGRGDPERGIPGTGALTKGAPAYPRRPDVDKATRAVLDALTDVVLTDDSQVSALTAVKVYRNEPGAVSFTSIAVTW